MLNLTSNEYPVAKASTILKLVHDFNFVLYRGTLWTSEIHDLQMIHQQAVLYMSFQLYNFLGLFLLTDIA